MLASDKCIFLNTQQRGGTIDKKHIVFYMMSGVMVVAKFHPIILNSYSYYPYLSSSVSLRQITLYMTLYCI